MLDTMEMNLLEWRYRIGREITRNLPPKEDRRAKDIALSMVASPPAAAPQDSL